MKLNDKHKEWLLNRGISSSVLDEFEIYSAYNRIVIPIKDIDGINLFNKYRRDPEDTTGPKYTYNEGATIKLFNIGILPKVKAVIICEGELDVLALKSHGFEAVTSTGGAQSFQKDWVPFFKDKEVFVCLDNDPAGESGTIKICRMLPEARVIPLPQEQGIKDITDFFQKYTNKEFYSLIKFAAPYNLPPEPAPKKESRHLRTGPRIQQAKDVPIGNFLKFNSTGKSACPFHTDKTPSLQRYKNNTWYCFSCGDGRDTIDFIMKREDINFNDAIDYLLK